MVNKKTERLKKASNTTNRKNQKKVKKFQSKSSKKKLAAYYDAMQTEGFPFDSFNCD